MINAKAIWNLEHLLHETIVHYAHANESIVVFVSGPDDRARYCPQSSLKAID